MSNEKKGVSKRTDGRYHAKVTVAPYKRVDVYAKTEQELKRKVKELKKTSLTHDLSKIRQITLQEYMQYWIFTVKKGDVNEKSLSRIESSCRNQIYPFIGRMQLQAINSNDIQRLINKLADTQSYSNLKKAYNNLNACLKYAEMNGHILKNPMFCINLPKVTSSRVTPPQKVTAYTNEQIKAIVDECNRKFDNGTYVYRYGNVILLLLSTGMRLGEALYLKWDDINLDSMTIYVHGTTTEYNETSADGSSAYIISDKDMPKSKSSIRYIPITKNSLEALQVLKETIGDDDRVIATRRHGIVCESTISRTMDKVLKACNITGVNHKIHALRHTFATYYIRNGESVEVLSKILGHASASITRDVYNHVIEEQKASAMARLVNMY